LTYYHKANESNQGEQEEPKHKKRRVQKQKGKVRLTTQEATVTFLNGKCL